MDPKGRMAIPTRIRDALLSSCAGRLVLTAHPEERCLLVYPEPRWQEVRPSIQALPTMRKAARRVQRPWICYACPLCMDCNGSVMVTSMLRIFADMYEHMILSELGDDMD